MPYHVTQRGVDRQATFSLDEDRHTYLRLLRENLSEADVRVWGWCLMSNHTHLILLPGREDSFASDPTLTLVNQSSPPPAGNYSSLTMATAVN